MLSKECLLMTCLPSRNKLFYTFLTVMLTAIDILVVLTLR